MVTVRQIQVVRAYSLVILGNNVPDKVLPAKIQQKLEERFSILSRYVRKLESNHTSGDGHKAISELEKSGSSDEGTCK